MATATAQTHCSQCSEEKEIYECKRCSAVFCFDHLTKHREGIDQEFIKIEDYWTSFQQTILDQKNDPNKRPLIQKIEQWKQESIQKIEQTAIQCQEQLIRYTNKFLIQTENQLDELIKQLKEIREKNQFNECYLYQMNERFTKLEKEFYHPPSVFIEQQPTSFINKISVIIPIDKDTKWKQHAITVVGKEKNLNPLENPYGISVDDDQTLYIADIGHHHIEEWKSNATSGRIVAGGNGQGNLTNRLHCPIDVIVDQDTHSLIIADQGNRRVMRWSLQNSTKHGQILLSDIYCYGLAMDKNGSLYVSDWIKNEVKRWKRGENDGIIVAGGNGNGAHLNQLDSPSFIFVDADESLYVSDTNNHRVMKWMKDAKQGMVVAGGNGEGNSLTQLWEPRSVAVDHLGQIYVADFYNHRVMRWCREAKEGTIVVGRNGGEQSNQFLFPIGLSFDRQGNLYVADSGDHRIQKFEIDENENNLFD